LHNTDNDDDNNNNNNNNNNWNVWHCQRDTMVETSVLFSPFVEIMSLILIKQKS